MKHYQNNKSGKTNSRGFYIALGICLVAIGVAAWTTYDSVVQYNDDSSPVSSQAEATGKHVSGVTISSTPQSSEASSEPPSQAPSSSEPPASSAPSSAVSDEPANTTPQPYQFPAGDTVTQAFSGDILVYSATMKDWRAHSGTDFSASEGDAVKAIGAGTVKEIREDVLYGTTAVVVHGSLEVWYCGLFDCTAKAGDSVAAGTPLGTVGTVPCEAAEPSHFHLMVKEEGVWIDPMAILNA